MTAARGDSCEEDSEWKPNTAVIAVLRTLQVGIAVEFLPQPCGDRRTGATAPRRVVVPLLVHGVLVLQDLAGHLDVGD